MTNTQFPGDLYLPGEFEARSAAMLLIIGARQDEKFVVIVYDDGRLRTVGWLSTWSIKNYYTHIIPELVGESHG